MQTKMRARKRQKVSNRMLLVWLTLGGFILLLGPSSLTNKFQGVFVHIFRVPLRIGRTVSLSAQVSNSLADDFKRKETQYRTHIANLNELLEQTQKKVEIVSGVKDRLSSLAGADLILADIITATLDGWRNELLINRGANDGIEQGQFVLGDNSVIGRISEVWPWEAKAQLLTDRTGRARLAVKVEGLDKVSWMYGCGNGKAKVFWIKNKVESGSIVWADKEPGFLDSPVVAGRVAQCTRNEENALLWDLTIRPTCDITMLKVVTVIVMNPVE